MTKKHEPTEKLRAEVQALASFGVPHDDIAIYISVTPKTLRRHYRRELDVAEIKANAAVAKRLFEHATTDSVAASIFWLKARAGWRQEPEKEIADDLTEAVSKLIDKLPG